MTQTGSKRVGEQAKFVLRMPAKMHRKLKREAKKEFISLNTLILQKLSEDK